VRQKRAVFRLACKHFGTIAWFENQPLAAQAPDLWVRSKMPPPRCPYNMFVATARPATGYATFRLPYLKDSVPESDVALLPHGSPGKQTGPPQQSNGPILSASIIRLDSDMLLGSKKRLASCRPIIIIPNDMNNTVASFIVSSPSARCGCTFYSSPAFVLLLPVLGIRRHTHFVSPDPEGRLKQRTTPLSRIEIRGSILDAGQRLTRNDITQGTFAFAPLLCGRLAFD
jgi:hypothetical protein